MLNRYLLSIIIISFSASVFSQSDVKIKSSEFKTTKPGYTEAWKHIKQGNTYYRSAGIWFSRAFEEYKQAYSYNSSNAELNYKIGISCLFSDKRTEAYDYLKKAALLKQNVTEDILLFTGRALMYNRNYASATEEFNSYLSSSVKKPDKNILTAKKWIEECNAGMSMSKDSLMVEINNAGSTINSSSDDYSEVLTADGSKMLFASRRPLTPDSRNYMSDTKFDENIYSSDYVNGAWTVAMLFNKNLTTKYCETPLFINSDGKVLYIYDGSDGGGDIKVSEFKNGKWKIPVPVRFKINTNSQESSFTISRDGSIIAFTSNRGKTGLGGKDIYFIKKSGKNKWSKPENLGTSVNTQFDEESVKFSSNSDTLWFSSKGHNTMGGFDIFYSTRLPDGKWSAAVNPGYPLNSPWDDLFYFPSAQDDGSFYFVSNRSGGFGGLDIYKGRFLGPLPKAAGSESQNTAPKEVKTSGEK